MPRPGELKGREVEAEVLQAERGGRGVEIRGVGAFRKPKCYFIRALAEFKLTLGGFSRIPQCEHLSCPLPPVTVPVWTSVH